MGKRIQRITQKIRKIRIEEDRIKTKLVLLLGIFTASFVISVQMAEKRISEISIVSPGQLSPQQIRLKNEITDMVGGYPMERMIPYIATKDEKVAAFMVGIAKKESNWGKHVPVLEGKDCYNYWGFRRKQEKMGSEGHTCFENPREAVNVVASRIENLVKEERLDTPKKMVIWKCGYACNGPSRTGSEKWIQDVSIYYDRILN